MAAALTSGYVQDMIAKTAEGRAKDIATLRQELTGVNAFPILGDDNVHAEPWPAASAPSGKSAIEITPMPAVTFMHSTVQISQNCGVFHA